MDISIVSVVRDFGIYGKCIGATKNPFVDGCEVVAIDNRRGNTPVSVCYNRFLDSFDYARPGWLVFCHEDWEVEEDLRSALEGLSEECLWGPVGARGAWSPGRPFRRRIMGQIEECRKDGSGLRSIGSPVRKGTVADSLDCQSLIVHSSLVQKFGLRFDPVFTFDLYVEDFCVGAREKYDIYTRTLPLKCCHWSYGTVGERYNTLATNFDRKWNTTRPYSGTSSDRLCGRIPAMCRILFKVRTVLWPVRTN